MATSVSNQRSFTEALKGLLVMEYEALEAYKATIAHLENAEYKSKLKEFHTDHELHAKELTELLQKHNELAPAGPAARQMLPNNRLSIAHFIEDKKKLMALQENESSILETYDGLYDYADHLEGSEAVLGKAIKNEEKHAAWIKKTIKAKASR